MDCRRPKDGRSRGFGFVEFHNAEGTVISMSFLGAGAQSALLLADSELCGREIVVSKSSRAITWLGECLSSTF